jgi:hypothetical protein
VARHISMKWRLTVQVLPWVGLVVLGKFLAHYFDVEYFSLSPLFGAFVSANVFLIGFLISGVLVDYKEGERLPGDLACSLETIVDESEIIYMNNKSNAALELITHIDSLLTAIIDWFHKKERTYVLMKKVSDFNPHFLALERHTQSPFISRMKIEQGNIRRMIVRIHTIRETDFNPSGYAIAELTSIILSIGLIFTKIEPYYESLFFVIFVSFVQIYMVKLIHHLDNPFSYYAAEHLTENISLKPLHDLKRRVAAHDAPEAAADPAAVAIAVPTPPKAQLSSVPSTGANPIKRTAKSKRRR